MRTSHGIEGEIPFKMPYTAKWSGTIYVAVRDDLNVPQKAVQSAHAILAFLNLWNMKPLPDDSIVITKVPYESDLIRLSKMMSDLMTPQAIFWEPAPPNYPIHKPGYTALATCEKCKVMQDLPLL